MSQTPEAPGPGGNCSLTVDADDGDERLLVERLRRGEERAYRIVVRRFHRQLVAFAARIIGSHAQAEEIVQDTWLAVLCKIGQFEGRSSLRAWLFAIVQNRACSRIRSERVTVAWPSEPGTQAGDGGGLLGLDDLDPERIAIGRELWGHALDAMATLSPSQRRVLMMRDHDGMGASHVCQTLDISDGNQRVLLHRARAKIRVVVAGRQAAPVSEQRMANALL